ncbi:hypothetical protein IEQ34_013186 [Dendrobium chrysotoxum]|uniref:Uncharacterized protein n=1 Tax=Dendrobium chrysotoxum TaxID=161865 RepID=A0AAV7GMU1_DENCH|nr:hypothetical protein IEQ34_013186 [Dendrobium chrysotoxum]
MCACSGSAFVSFQMIGRGVERSLDDEAEEAGGMPSVADRREFASLSKGAGNIDFMLLNFLY